VLAPQRRCLYQEPARRAGQSRLSRQLFRLIAVIRNGHGMSNKGWNRGVVLAEDREFG